MWDKNVCDIQQRINRRQIIKEIIMKDSIFLFIPRVFSASPMRKTGNLYKNFIINQFISIVYAFDFRIYGISTVLFITSNQCMLIHTHTHIYIYICNTYKYIYIVLSTLFKCIDPHQ